MMVVMCARMAQCSGGGVHVCFVLLMSVAGTRRVCCVQVVMYMYVLFC